MNDDQATRLVGELKVLVPNNLEVDLDDIQVAPSPLSGDPAKCVMVLGVNPDNAYIMISTGEEPDTFYVGFYEGEDDGATAFITSVPGWPDYLIHVLDAVKFMAKGVVVRP